MTRRVRVVLAAQRVARWTPISLRRFARKLLSSGTDVPILDDWSSPIVSGQSGDPLGPARPEVALARDQQRSAEGAPDAIRCLLVTESLDAGGMDEFVGFLARGLPAHGFVTAALIAPVGPSRGMGPIAQELYERGIDVFDAGEHRSAEEWIRRWAPDVIAVHGNAKWPLDTAGRIGVPAVLVLHGMHDLFDMSEDEVLDRYTRLTAVISVSELVRRQYLAKSRSIDEARVIAIPNGIDVQRTRSVDRAAARKALGLRDEFLFLSLARHCMQKNTYGLVKTFDEVVRGAPNTHLLVCGRVDDVQYTNQVVALRDRLRSRDRIHLRENSRRPDLLLAAADGFVLNSFFEGWALASMEALVQGTPVIMSDVGGAREQLTGGAARGALVTNPIGDPLAVDWRTIARARFARQANHDELVSALGSLATGRMEIASREMIASESADRFSASRCIASHARILRAVAAGAPLLTPGPRSAVDS